jgi:hypothetical protein
MENRIVGVVTLVCFIMYLGGCSTSRFIPLEEYREKNPTKNYTIMAVMTTDSTLYEFRYKPDRVMVADGNLTGTLKNGEVKSIPLSDIKTIKIQNLETVKILLLTGAGLAVFVILMAIIVSSMDLGVGVNATVHEE